MTISSDFLQKYTARLLPMPQAEVYLINDFLPKQDADILLQMLLQEVNWRQEKVKLFGKEIDQPRLTAWYADAGKAYTYSGLTWQPQPWLPALNSLRDKLQKSTGITFNSVLLNLYRHGQDSMGWHADNEPELGPNPVIASISLGQPRSFALKHNQQPHLKQSLLLKPGSLLLMAGGTQHFWKHQLPKSTRTMAPRINLTFRYIY